MNKKIAAPQETQPHSNRTTDSNRNRLAILNRLDKVKQTGPDQWRARCPAHGSKGLTLSLKDTGESLLLHCFAGCAPADVLASVGLELGDLYDGPVNSGPVPRQNRIRVTAADVLRAIRSDVILLATIHREHAQRFEAAEVALVVELTGRIIRAMEVVV